MWLERKEGKGFNWLSLAVGLAVLVFWCYFVSRLAPANQVRMSHTILLMGFGAIFSLFVIKFASFNPAAVSAAAIGLVLAVAAFLAARPRLTGPWAFLSLVSLIVLIAAPAYLALRRLMPRRLSLRGAELAVIYAMVVVGIATAVVSRSTLMSAAALWDKEWRLENWYPPQYLPSPNARDDVTSAGEPAAPQAKTAPTKPTLFDKVLTNGNVFQEKGAKMGYVEGKARAPWFSWFLSGYGRDRELSGWTFPMIFWTVVLLSVEFFFLFLALAFRKRWVEEERMPFPMAQLPIGIVSESEGERKLFSNRAAWIAFVIGFALCLRPVLAISATNALPIGPALSYIFIDPLRTQVDLTGYQIIPGLYFVMWLAPMVLVLMLFLPVDVLMTALVTFFVTQAGCRWLAYELGTATDWPTFFSRGIEIGGAVGLVFWTLVFHWQEIARLANGFLRYVRSAGERRYLNFRNLMFAFWAAALALAAWIYPTIYGAGYLPATRWLILSGTVLLFLYLALSSKRSGQNSADQGPVSPGGLAILIAASMLTFAALTLPGRTVGLFVMGSLIIFVFSFTGMRARGETLMQDMYVYDQGRLDAAAGARWVPGPSAPGFPTPENHWWGTPPGVMSNYLTWELGVMYRYWAPHNSFLDTFKLGHEAGASVRDIFKAIVIGLVVAAALTPFLTLFYSYTYGAGGRNGPTYWYEDYLGTTARAYIFDNSPMETPRYYDDSKIYTWPLLGFVTIGVMMYMRREYSWFPLHPIGFLMGAWMYQPFGSVRDMWFTLLVAFIVKRQVFKWFGVRFFREKVQGVLVFAAMGMVLAIVLYILRFALEFGIGIFKWS